MSKFLIPAIFFVLLTGCLPQKRTSSAFSNLQVNLNKADIISKYGNPFKTSFTYDQQGVLCEELFYKEVLYKEIFYEITNILSFKNGKLVSVQQGQEKRLFNDTTVITK